MSPLRMSRMYRPADTATTAPRIELTPMPQLAEATNKKDDWTGTTDAASRRRAQTRLNTRAYRKKTEGFSKESRKGVQCHVRDIHQTRTTGGMLGYGAAVRFHGSSVPYQTAVQCANSLIPGTNSDRQQQYNNIAFPLSPDHLITLLQYNVLRALSVNRTLISGILTTPLDCSEETIHVLSYRPSSNSQSLLPPSLLPTTLQQTVPHGDWVDIFPCPAARDRVIRAAGTFDEDELWADCIGGAVRGLSRRRGGAARRRCVVAAVGRFGVGDVGGVRAEVGVVICYRRHGAGDAGGDESVAEGEGEEALWYDIICASPNAV
ncbi:hypothetical protein PG997_011507 [Apiospora hydei]|uniref:Uncharacterized protein n=1 Tax=Apiospora hydei TaxID=1337664 RepID=A0ABR1VJ98_9PEZI